MRVPIRKLGKYAHLKPDPCITREKYKELEVKLERLKKKQPHARAEVKRLAADGDFSENAAYQMAKGRLRGLNQRVQDIEDHLKRAIIIESKNTSGVVQLGSFVTVKTGEKIKTYKILGSSETDPFNNTISHNSPIGSALMGSRMGDIVKVQLADKEVSYKIIKIE